MDILVNCVKLMGWHLLFLSVLGKMIYINYLRFCCT